LLFAQYLFGFEIICWIHGLSTHRREAERRVNVRQGAAARVEGVVRGGALLTGQTPDALAAIKSPAAEAMKSRFRDADGYGAPIVAFVGPESSLDGRA
jgi:hypothetical protein